MKFSHTTQRQQLLSAYTRSGTIFVNEIQDMEKDIARMKEKKVAQEYIDRKDLQIENLANYYNTVDDAISFMKMELLNLQLENHFLTQLVAHKVTVDELIRYKPTTRTVIEKVEETNQPQNLTSL